MFHQATGGAAQHVSAVTVKDCGIICAVDVAAVLQHNQRWTERQLMLCIPLEAFSVWTGAGGGFVERRLLLKNQCWLCTMDATKCHVCLLLSPAPSAGATAVSCFVPWLQADVPAVWIQLRRV
jgi:hypothetical protein